MKAAGALTGLRLVSAKGPSLEPAVAGAERPSLAKAREIADGKARGKPRLALRFSDG